LFLKLLPIPSRSYVPHNKQTNKHTHTHTHTHTYIYIFIYLFFLWPYSQTRAMASSFLKFVDHTQPRNTFCRTPLDEWSARRRDLYLATHSTQKNNNHSCPQKDSNPHSQQSSACTSTPETGIGHCVHFALIILSDSDSPFSISHFQFLNYSVMYLWLLSYLVLDVKLKIWQFLPLCTDRSVLHYQLQCTFRRGFVYRRTMPAYITQTIKTA